MCSFLTNTLRDSKYTELNAMCKQNVVPVIHVFIVNHSLPMDIVESILNPPS